MTATVYIRCWFLSDVTRTLELTFTNKRARRALVYANIMIFLSQFTGINNAVLMSQVSFDSTQANYMSLVGGGALLIGTISAIFYIDRRFWTLTMLPGCFIGLILVGIGYELPITNTVAVQGVYLTGFILYKGFFGCYDLGYPF